MTSTKPSRASAQAARARMQQDPDDDDDNDDGEEEFEFNDEPSSAAKQKQKPVKEEAMDDDEDDELISDLNKKKRKRPESSSSTTKASAAKRRPKSEATTPKPSAKPKSNSNRTSSSSTKSETKPKKPVKKEDLSSTTTKSKLKLKQLDKTERLQHAMQSFLWWDAPEPPAGCQWNTLEHAGVSFPDPYQPHRIPLLYMGQEIALTPAQEEAATFFAATDPDGMHLGNPATAKIFIDNFFADFVAMVKKDKNPATAVIKDFKHCDFGPMRRHLAEQKMIRKAVTDAERQAAKDDRSSVLHQFGYALVDGHLERVGNYNMEPPGAFRGRGAHPKMGQLKHRVRPEQVSLNVSEQAPVPRCPIPGHAWGDVRHDPKGQWLATWKENINNQVSACTGMCVCAMTPKNIEEILVKD